MNLPVRFNRQHFDMWLRWNDLKFRVAFCTLDHALRAMHYLNRDVKNFNNYSDYRQKVYAIKTDFIRFLYQRGLVDHVTKQTQVLVCNRCLGNGKNPYSGYDEYEADYCERCDGTGEYARHLLYKFYVGEYVWHQPESLAPYLHDSWIDWDEQDTYTLRPDHTLQLNSPNLREYWFAVLVVFLTKQGVDTRKHNLVRLRDAFSFYKPAWVYNLKRRFKVRRPAPVIPPDMDADIPF